MKLRFLFFQSLQGRKDSLDHERRAPPDGGSKHGHVGLELGAIPGHQAVDEGRELQRFLTENTIEHDTRRKPRTNGDIFSVGKRLT